MCEREREIERGGSVYEREGVCEREGEIERGGSV